MFATNTTKSLIMTSTANPFLTRLCRFRRRTYVTPKTFITFLAAYKGLYRKKVEDIEVLAIRMKTGLSKLVEAQVSVDVLRKELAVKEKEMLVATEAAEKVQKH